MPNPENLKPFKKGTSGNPKGRPVGIPNSKTRLTRILKLTQELENPVTKELEEFTVAEQLDLAQIAKARKGDTRAYQVLMERLEGRPVQDIDVTTNGQNIVMYMPEKLPDDYETETE